jgi:hypothetical protein
VKIADCEKFAESVKKVHRMIGGKKWAGRITFRDGCFAAESDGVRATANIGMCEVGKPETYSLTFLLQAIEGRVGQLAIENKHGENTSSCIYAESHYEAIDHSLASMQGEGVSKKFAWRGSADELALALKQVVSVANHKGERAGMGVVLYGSQIFALNPHRIHIVDLKGESFLLANHEVNSIDYANVRSLLAAIAFAKGSSGGETAFVEMSASGWVVVTMGQVVFECRQSLATHRFYLEKLPIIVANPGNWATVVKVRAGEMKAAIEAVASEEKYCTCKAEAGSSMMRVISAFGVDRNVSLAEGVVPMPDAGQAPFAFSVDRRYLGEAVGAAKVNRDAVIELSAVNKQTPIQVKNGAFRAIIMPVLT